MQVMAATDETPQGLPRQQGRETVLGAFSGGCWKSDIPRPGTAGSILSPQQANMSSRKSLMKVKHGNAGHGNPGGSLCWHGPTPWVGLDTPEAAQAHAWETLSKATANNWQPTDCWQHHHLQSQQ